MGLNEYTTLGRSGLRVSRLCLGAMTFGTEWGIGADENVSRALFSRYLEAGGNFIDTADIYNGGGSEELLGKFVAERSLRDHVVIATKFAHNAHPGNPNAGGNGRKNIYRAIDRSLRRLNTDYIDLYYLHVWDVVTPVEEVISTLSDLVRDGKIRYYGFSDTPAWYLARAQTLAEKEGKERLVALQLEYSLAERNIEREHIPAAQELGIAVCPWGPLASGLLSGKYKQAGTGMKGQGRLETTKGSGRSSSTQLSDRDWHLIDVLLEFAEEIGKTPAQVALNWVVTQPGITSTTIGATKVAQLDDNLGALEFTIPTELRPRLAEASAIETFAPYNFFGPTIQGFLTGGNSVEAWAPSQLYDRTVRPYPAFLKEKDKPTEK